ncbi:hypothetical protein BDF14DRAFT_1782846 [Spinellus fusiger]|nr:hypothetical protein BDF14DRAFT_1782846 [Spinellus fusiger]
MGASTLYCPKIHVYSFNNIPSFFVISSCSTVDTPTKESVHPAVQLSLSLSSSHTVMTLLSKEIVSQKKERLRALLSEGGFGFSTRLKASLDISERLDPIPIAVEPIETELVPIITPTATVQPRLEKRRRIRAKEMDSNSATTTVLETKAAEDVYVIESLLNQLGELSEKSPTLPSLQVRKETLKHLVELPTKELQVVCQQVAFNEWPEMVAIELLSILHDMDIVPSSAALLLQWAVYPRIATLKTSVSRLFISHLYPLGQSMGKTVVDALLLPLMAQTSLDRPQLEVIHKMITGVLSPFIRLIFFKTVVSTASSHATLKNTMSPPWNDTMTNIISAVLGTQPFVTIDTALFYDLIECIRFTVAMDKKNKGCMQLLLMLTTKYAYCFMENDRIELVQGIVELSDVFLKRAVQAQLVYIRKKLQTPHAN